jgi:hypothetical protein
MGGPPRPPQAKPQTSSRFLLGVIAGVLAAAIVAVVLYFLGALPSKDNADHTSTASISLPAAVGTFVRFEDASPNQNARAKKSVAYSEKVDQRSATALSSAYGGAGAAQQTYADDTLGSTFTVRAVRAATPQPFVGYQDPSYLGLATAPTEVRTYGPVRCLIAYSPPTPAASTPPASSVLTQSCQRTSGKLTVILSATGAGELSHQPERCAALVDEVWAKLL